MTYQDALHSIIQHSTSSRAIEAVKLLRRIESGDPSLAARQADRLIRMTLGEERKSFPDAAEMEALITHEPPTTKTVTVRFRCTENDRNILGLLAEKYAGGNMSRLILETLREKYQTI